jgi:predicted nucleic acid-binding protein
MYLLDTNVISETRKPMPNKGLMDWIADVMPRDLFLSVLSLGEISKGIEKLRARDERGAGDITRWLEDVEEAFDDRILPVDRRVALMWGQLSARVDDNAVDIMLAATAKVHNLVLVTRNVRDVSAAGVDVVNPFST